MPIEFANAIALDPEKVNCFVKSRIDGLCFEIIGFLSKGVSQSHSTINQYATVTNLNQHASYNGTSSTPIFGTQPNERHGWVGTVEEFLKACLDNSLIDEFEHENISMRRSIQFSTNHLAVSLRKLSVLSASLVDHMVVIIEFRVGIGGKRVDAVLAINTGDTSTPLAMYAIEMKAWSPAFKDTFEMIEQSIGNDLFPSSVRYKAKKEGHIKVRTLSCKYEDTYKICSLNLAQKFMDVHGSTTYKIGSARRLISWQFKSISQWQKFLSGQK